VKAIEFDAEGEPKGQPRPRAFARKMGGKFVARVYDAGTAEGWKSQVAAAARPFLAMPIEEPLALSLDFRMPRPKAHFGKRGLKEWAPSFFTGRPDVDNLAKAVMDALTILGLWTEDALVVRLCASKRYIHTGERPGVHVRVVPAGETSLDRSERLVGQLDLVTA
jgi:Holliday junction resolvase RusA-like endonuclease